MVALKLRPRPSTSAWQTMKQERRGGIETDPVWIDNPVADKKQERRGGIETGTQWASGGSR